MVNHPILYSFRRCPYAMRARMALLHSGVEVELREVVLRDRPPCMLEYSPKGTVPIMVLPDGKVIEESMDIMLHVLSEEMLQGDWQNLVDVNDGEFKFHLDRYKYPDRYDEVPPDCRSVCLSVLEEYDSRLEEGYLCGDEMSIADMALMPFVRQFANTDRGWFDQQDIPNVHRWLRDGLESELFKGMMGKYRKWVEGDAVTLFP